MKNVLISDKDQLVMSLVHYFVTKENYSPIVVQGTKEEIWLENLSAPYKVIRINSKYIHNNEQHEADVAKVKHVLKQIKKKTLSLKLNALNICVDTAQRVDLNNTKLISNINLKTLDDITSNDLLNNSYPKINVNSLKKADNLDLILNVTNDINEKTERENKLFEEIFKSKKIIVTPIIIAICISMFLITMIFGNGATDIYTLLYYGGNNLLLVQEGQIFRLITGAFLHAGILHLLVNMYSLYIIGSQLEQFVGKIKFAGMYLISALTGSMLSLVFSDGSIVSVGASGAIFGLLGALLYFGYHYRMYLNDVLRRQIVPIIIINLLIGFTVPGIDNAAHIGGLIGGYFAAVAFGLKGKSEKREMISGIISLIALVGFMSYMIFK